MLAAAEESSHCRVRRIPEAGATGLAEDRTGVKDEALVLSLGTQGPQLGPPGAQASLSHERPRPEVLYCLARLLPNV